MERIEGFDEMLWIISSSVNLHSGNDNKSPLNGLENDISKITSLMDKWGLTDYSGDELLGFEDEVRELKMYDVEHLEWEINKRGEE